VAINNADDAWSTTFSTGLPMGLYCNVVEGPPKAGTCSGTSYVQSHGFFFPSRQPAHPIYYRRFQIGFDGTLTVTVGPRQAIALHTGAQGMGLPTPEPVQQVSILFSETATTTPGEVSCPIHRFRRRAP
jgi:hypothetical protein